MWLVGPWIFPVVAALVWLGMLLGMFVTWELGGANYNTAPRSKTLPAFDPGRRIAFISEVGAFRLKPLFIAGSCVTMVSFALSFISERWLRHTGILAQNTSKAQKILSGFSIFFAVLGSAGLILLSIFDTYRYGVVHNGCLLLFLGGYILSAIFACAQYQRLGIHYRNHRILRISFWVKLTFIFFEGILAIIFIATNFTGKGDVAAIFEWIVALVFTFYILSYLLDLLPSVRTSSHVPQGLQKGPRIGKGQEEYINQNGEVQTEQDLTHDSAGPMQDHAGYRGTAPAGYTNGDVTHNGQNRGFGRLHRQR